MLCLGPVGLLTTFLALDDFQKLFGYNRKSTLYFWTFIQSTVSWGFLACSIFMFLNYYLASKNFEKETFEIVERSSLPGRKHHRYERKPTFKIIYKDNLKELVFTHKYYDKMDSYQNIELLVKEGFFGFDILIDQRVK